MTDADPAPGPKNKPNGSEVVPVAERHLQTQRPAAERGLDVRIALLEEKVSALEDRRGWQRFAKSAALVLGVMGALFALPLGIFDVCQLFVGEQIRVMFSPGFQLAADLGRDTVSFTFDSEAQNEGERASLLSAVSAILRNPTDDSASFLPFSLSDATCSADHEAFRFPISIGSEGTHITCTLTNRWTGRAKQILSGDGERELEINFVANTGPSLGHTFCFALPVNLENWVNEVNEPLRFEEARCLSDREKKNGGRT